MRTLDQKVYTEKYFIECCEGHDEWKQFKEKKLPPRLMEAFRLADIRKGTNVLDFGCGRGELSAYSAARGANVVGLDYSETAIKLSKKITRPATGKLLFQLIKGHKLPLKNNSVEVVFFIDVIEHLYQEEVIAILSEFKRVLNNKGKVIMHTAPNKAFYDYGYKYFTRYANFLANLTVWPILFKEKLTTTKDPRSDYERQMHINECDTKMVVSYFESAGFKTKVWLSSDFRKIRIRDKIKYFFLQPDWWPFRRWFSYDIWAIASA